VVSLRPVYPLGALENGRFRTSSTRVSAAARAHHAGRALASATRAEYRLGVVMFRALVIAAALVAVVPSVRAGGA
jgi:hypothetical protein